MFTGLDSVVPLAADRASYVKPGNNHHVAIYKAADGSFCENVCTFWHAVERKKFGLPVVIRQPDTVWEEIIKMQGSLPDSFLEQLPKPDWQFVLEMQQNQMFLLGLTAEQISDLQRNADKVLISKYLYRIQRLSASDYYFRHHLETKVDEKIEDKKLHKFYRLSSFSALMAQNPTPVRISRIGEIEFPEMANHD